MKPNCDKCGKNFANCDCFVKPQTGSDSASFDGSTGRSEREIDLELALTHLCVCKLHKDQYGKTEEYERSKARAWDRAFKLLGL